MKVTKVQNKIIIEGLEDFNIVHILECGQVFRFNKFENFYRVISTDKKADIYTFGAHAEIITNDVDYFYNYFDLNTEYSKIKSQLAINDLMNKAIKHGCGIRILRQDKFESIISFIISANNNIKRIQGIIERLCKAYGTNCGEYFAFPTLEQLYDADEKFFKSIGAGYRSKYLAQAIKQLAGEQNHLLNTQEVTRRDLQQIMGVGPKVADCILLFGYYKQASFPVDTWIAQVYADDFSGKSTDRIKIAKYFSNLFGNLSGYAQQYLFYYKRETEVEK